MPPGMFPGIAATPYPHALPYPQPPPALPKTTRLPPRAKSTLPAPTSIAPDGPLHGRRGFLDQARRRFKFERTDLQRIDPIFVSQVRKQTDTNAKMYSTNPLIQGHHPQPHQPSCHQPLPQQQQNAVLMAAMQQQMAQLHGAEQDGAPNFGPIKTCAAVTTPASGEAAKIQSDAATGTVHAGAYDAKYDLNAVAIADDGDEDEDGRGQAGNREQSGNDEFGALTSVGALIFCVLIVFGGALAFLLDSRAALAAKAPPQSSWRSATASPIAWPVETPSSVEAPASVETVSPASPADSASSAIPSPADPERLELEVEIKVLRDEERRLKKEKQAFELSPSQLVNESKADREERLRAKSAAWSLWAQKRNALRLAEDRLSAMDTKARVKRRVEQLRLQRELETLERAEEQRRKKAEREERLQLLKAQSELRALETKQKLEKKKAELVRKAEERRADAARTAEERRAEAREAARARARVLAERVDSAP